MLSFNAVSVCPVWSCRSRDNLRLSSSCTFRSRCVRICSSAVRCNSTDCNWECSGAICRDCLVRAHINPPRSGRGKIRTVLLSLARVVELFHLGSKESEQNCSRSPQEEIGKAHPRFTLTTPLERCSHKRKGAGRIPAPSSQFNAIDRVWRHHRIAPPCRLSPGVYKRGRKDASNHPPAKHHLPFARVFSPAAWSFKMSPFVEKLLVCTLFLGCSIASFAQTTPPPSWVYSSY